MNKRISLTLMLVLAWSSDTSLAESRGLTILAPSTCQEWLAEQAAQSSVTVSVVKIPTRHFWLLGLMSGLNANYPSQKDLLLAVNSSLIFDWMDNYCKKNPQSDVYYGANLLLKEIEKQK